MMVGAGVLSNPWLFGGGGTIRGAREPLFDKTSGLGTKGLSGGGTIVVMADGSVRHVSGNVDPRVFKAMCTIHGADSVDLDRAAPAFALNNCSRPIRPAFFLQQSACAESVVEPERGRKLNTKSTKITERAEQPFVSA